MKRMVIALALACGGSAAANDLPLVPQRGAEELPLPSKKASPLRPIPYLYRQIDRESVNSGTVGRTNATRGEQQETQTGWWPPGLGGNPM
jgi:hypothetical protein